MELKKYINKKRVCVLSKTNKNDVLSELLEVISNSIEIKDILKMKKGILYRESLMSTGLGLGVGVPHIRTEEIKEIVVAVGVSHTGIEEYESIDDSKIKVVIMILAGVGQHKEYIKLLSLIISKLKEHNIINTLTEAKNASEIYSILVENRND